MEIGEHRGDIRAIFTNTCLVFDVCISSVIVIL